MSATYDGINLLVASNDGQGSETCYWFRRCMTNELFTFYRVGYRAVDRGASSTAGIMLGTGITWLNSAASSDNIGPVSIAGYADFVGGNHPWREPDAAGNKGRGSYTIVRTARCDSVAISIGGTTLLPGHTAECVRVDIDVWNTLMDPLVEPDSGAAVLPSPLLDEHAHYTVQAGSVSVDMAHHYRRDVTVSRYYGMQSMCLGEDSILTPGGAYPKWAAAGSVANFRKSDYPDFDRYVEHTPSGWLQSSWMRHTGLGTHEQLDAGSIIFVRGSGKCYHVLLNGNAVKADSTLRWQGIYSWARPLVNDSALLVYRGAADSREALYVDALAPIERVVTLPAGWRTAHIASRRGDIDVTSTKQGQIRVVATGTASVMLVRDDDGDLNADGIVDIDDANTLINILLGYSGNTLQADINGDGVIDVDDVNVLINAMLGRNV